MEGDNETENILNPLKEGRIGILHQIRSIVDCDLTAPWRCTYLDQGCHSLKT